MRYTALIIAFMLTGSVCLGQSGVQKIKKTDALNSLFEKEEEGVLTISLDSLIEENYNKLLVQGSKLRGVRGYRIRIFSDNGHGAKDNQKRVLARFLSLFPDIATYYPYEDTYYKIYVGDFRTKRNAMLALDRIDGKYPNAFIVEANIVIEE